MGKSGGKKANILTPEVQACLSLLQIQSTKWRSFSVDGMKTWFTDPADLSHTHGMDSGFPKNPPKRWGLAEPMWKCISSVSIFFYSLSWIFWRLNGKEKNKVQPYEFPSTIILAIGCHTCYLLHFSQLTQLYTFATYNIAWGPIYFAINSFIENVFNHANTYQSCVSNIFKYSSGWLWKVLTNMTFLN